MIRIRSSYSINQSTININDYLEELKRRNINEAVIVDTTATFFYDFYSQCKNKQLKPIFGFEKENEYIIFPTNNESIKTFFNIVNGDEDNFKDIIVYKLNSNLNFKGSNTIIKSFDHDIYNCINLTNIENELLKSPNKINFSEYKIDENLISESRYELEYKNNTYEFENASKMLKSLVLNELKKKEYNSIYLERIKQELKVIDKMNFSTYFLIYVTIINYLRKNNIEYGISRGSFGSSLVAYILKISKLDPIKYNLIFERFLNESRKNAPDIDLDVDSKYRSDVISTILKKFSNSAKISVVNTYSYNEALKILNKYYNLHELTIYKIKNNENVENLIKQNEKIKELIFLAKKMTKIVKQMEIHPAGIIISNKPLKEYVQVVNNVIYYDYKDLDAIGLLKFDILSSNFINKMSNLKLLVKKNNNESINKKFNFNDKNVFALINNIENKYLFQIDTKLSKNNQNEFKINSLDDLAILISLNRPGTLKIKEQIINNKKNNIGNEKNTYKTIVYQEQIINMLKNSYNLSKEKADLIRYAISKKNTTVLESFRKYINKNNYDPKYLELAINFSGYGFNKSHAFAYAKMLYIQTWFKNYYPIQFYEAFNNGQYDKDDILYLKLKKIHFIEFNNSDRNEINGNSISLSIKNLNIDNNIKNEIIKNDVNDIETLKWKFKISYNDISSIIASKVFSKNIKTSEKFEIENFDKSTIIKLHNWKGVENKLKYNYSIEEFNLLQLKYLGFSFENSFKNNNVFKIEELRKVKNFYRGTAYCNYGLINFIMFNDLGLKENKEYIIEYSIDNKFEYHTFIFKNLIK